MWIVDVLLFNERNWMISERVVLLSRNQDALVVNRVADCHFAHSQLPRIPYSYDCNYAVRRSCLGAAENTPEPSTGLGPSERDMNGVELRTRTCCF